MKLKQPHRQLLSLLLLTTSLLSAIPLSAGTFTIGPLTYIYDIWESTAEVDKCDKNASGELIIPESFELSGKTYSVTEIGISAFEGCSGLTSVTIPSSVTEIWLQAFSGCNSLTSVTIPNSVTTINVGTFEGCSGLTSVTIPNSVTSISVNAFKGCSGLTSVIIPNSVTSIGTAAFEGCSSLTSVAIPSSLTSIGNSTFSGCSSLTSVTIPNSVTSIGERAFSGCSALANIHVESGNPTYCSLDGVLFNSDKSNLVLFPEGKSGEYQIPSSVTSIHGGAFSGCNGLTSLTISGTIKFAYINELMNCNGLQKVYIYSGRYSYSDFILPSQAKLYTFRECYSGSNAIYLDFLQPQHITSLNAGVTIDYSERFNSFDVDGYEIKSLKITNYDNVNAIVNIPLHDDGKYLVKLPEPCRFNISMEYFDPRAGGDITTTVGPYITQSLVTFYGVETTESTVSYTYEAHEDASTGDFLEFVFDGSTVTDKRGRITRDGLYPGGDFRIYYTVKFKDGRVYSYLEGPRYLTKNIVFSPDVQRVTPTAIELEWSYDAGDAADQVTEVGFEAPNPASGSTEGNKFYYCGTSMPVNSPVEVKYFVRIGDREYQKSETFTLPELVLNTIAAKATSNDCAIICAETNMSEMETSCGFEWRRYDAPDMVPSNFVNCPVNNGMMAGKLMGLSSNTYYKYRPFYEDMNGNMTYGGWTAFGTADAYVYFEPTVYTYVPTRVARTSAVITGYALGGSDDVIEQGFEYSVVPTGRAAVEPVRVPATGIRMTATLTDLLPGTTYSVRAYATTVKETTYGEEQRFTTEGEEQDAIEMVEVEEAAGFDVYTLSGVCVRRNTTDLNGLRPGIYIANGRKFIVR